MTIQGAPGLRVVGTTENVLSDIGAIEFPKIFTRGTLHPNELGNYRTALEMQRVVMLPVEVPGTMRDDDDQLSEAHPLTIHPAEGVSVDGVLRSASDVDMYRIPLDRYRRIHITLARRKVSGAELSDPVLRVFDRAGNQLALADNVSAADKRAVVSNCWGGEPSQSEMYFGVSAAPNGTGGTPYEPVSGRGDQRGYGRGAYRLTVKYSNQVCAAFR